MDTQALTKVCEGILQREPEILALSLSPCFSSQFSFTASALDTAANLIQLLPSNTVRSLTLSTISVLSIPFALVESVTRLALGTLGVLLATLSPQKDLSEFFVQHAIHFINASLLSAVYPFTSSITAIIAFICGILGSLENALPNFSAGYSLTASLQDQLFHRTADLSPWMEKGVALCTAPLFVTAGIVEGCAHGVLGLAGTSLTIALAILPTSYNSKVSAVDELLNQWIREPSIAEGGSALASFSHPIANAFQHFFSSRKHVEHAPPVTNTPLTQ